MLNDCVYLGFPTELEATDISSSTDQSINDNKYRRNSQGSEGGFETTENSTHAFSTQGGSTIFRHLNMQLCSSIRMSFQ